MKLPVRIAVVLALMITILCCSTKNDSSAENPTEENTSAFLPDDPRVLKATKAAQDSLVYFVNFWDIHGGEDGFHFFLKRSFKDGPDQEHMWSRLVRSYNEGFLGVLDNEPEIIQNYSVGDTVRIKFKDVEDYMIIMPDSSIVGNYLQVFTMQDSIR